MEITVSAVQGRVPVTILEPHGDLDGSNYRELIAQGQAASQAGVQRILIDMHDVPYISSAGLVALHTIAGQLRGTKTPDADSGWQALHAMSQDAQSTTQRNLKLCALADDVKRVLLMAGLTDFYEQYPDRETALASF